MVPEVLGHDEYNEGLWGKYRPGKKIIDRDFLGGPVVKNLPSNARDTGSIPGLGTEIPHAVGQLSPWAITK